MAIVWLLLGGKIINVPWYCGLPGIFFFSAHNVSTFYYILPLSISCLWEEARSSCYLLFSSRWYKPQIFINTNKLLAINPHNLSIVTQYHIRFILSISNTNNLSPVWKGCTFWVSVATSSYFLVRKRVPPTGVSTWSIKPTTPYNQPPIHHQWPHISPSIFVVHCTNNFCVMMIGMERKTIVLLMWLSHQINFARNSGEKRRY